MNRELLEATAGPFSEWQQSVAIKNLDKQSSEKQAEIAGRQHELLEAVLSGPPALAGYLRRELGLEGVTLDGLPFPRDELTPSEFKEPPIELERELAECWAGLVSRREASQPVFWTIQHLGWIEENRIGGGDLSRALTTREKSLDGQVRDCLRRLGGIYVRGNVSVFSDCPMARAWWRGRLAQAAAEHGESISLEDAHLALHEHRPVWETLVMLSLRRLTVLNQPPGAGGAHRRPHRRGEAHDEGRSGDCEGAGAAGAYSFARTHAMGGTTGDCGLGHGLIPGRGASGG